MAATLAGINGSGEKEVIFPTPTQGFFFIWQIELVSKRSVVIRNYIPEPSVYQ